MMNCCNCYRTDGKRNDCYYHIPAMAAYSNERVAAIVVSVLYRMLTVQLRVSRTVAQIVRIDGMTATSVHDLNYLNDVREDITTA